MITNVLTNLGITRDSVLWFWGKLVGLVVLITALGGETAYAQYGISPKWFHVIQLLAAWLMIFSAQQSTSNLNAKKSAWFLPLLLAGGLGLSACASLNVSAEKLVHAAIVQSEQLHTSRALTDDQFKAVNLELNKVAVAGREWTKLVIAKSDQPADALTFLKVVQQVTANLQAAPYGGAVAHVLEKLTQLESVLGQLAGK